MLTWHKLIFKLYSKKIHCLTLRIDFKKYTSWRECEALFLSVFNFSWKFHWNSSRLLKDINFYFFNFNIFLQVFAFFCIFFNLTCCKRTISVSIYKIISVAFWLRIVLDRLLKKCIVLLPAVVSNKRILISDPFLLFLGSRHWYKTSACFPTFASSLFKVWIIQSPL